MSIDTWTSCFMFTVDLGGSCGASASVGLLLTYAGTELIEQNVPLRPRYSPEVTSVPVLAVPGRLTYDNARLGLEKEALLEVALWCGLLYEPLFDEKPPVE